eukprot:6472249-Amphidinium_carterae.1
MNGERSHKLRYLFKQFQGNASRGSAPGEGAPSDVGCEQIYLYENGFKGMLPQTSNDERSQNF